MNIIKTLLVILSIVVFGVVAFFAINRFDRFMDIKAIHDCAQDYRQEITDSNGKVVSRPMEQQTHDCAFQKGVKNWTGIWTDLTH